MMRDIVPEQPLLCAPFAKTPRNSRLAFLCHFVTCSTEGYRIEIDDNDFNGVIYRQRAQTFYVVAIMHYKRKPGYWL